MGGVTSPQLQCSDRVQPCGYHTISPCPRGACCTKGALSESALAEAEEGLPEQQAAYIREGQERLAAGEVPLPCSLASCGRPCANAAGPAFGFCSVKHRDAFSAETAAVVHRVSSGGTEALWEAADADEVAHYCSLVGVEPPLAERIRPDVQESATRQAAMYLQLLEDSSSEGSDALAALRQAGAMLPRGLTEEELTARCLQPPECGAMTSTYAVGFKRLVQLHHFSRALASAVQSPHEVRCSVKSPLRLRRKVLEDGPEHFWLGNFRQVADVYRASVFVDSILDVHRLLCVLKSLCREEPGRRETLVLLGLDGTTAYVVERLKNRFAEPCAHGGYVDVLVHVRVDGYVAEVQLHWRPAFLMRQEEGHRTYSWSRRFLARTENRYQGQLCSSFLRSGRGTQHYVSGALYQGEWRNDLRHGQGALLLASGDSYDGGWVGGKMHGDGRYFYTNGERYSGQWFGGHKHGTGTYEYLSGNRYTGSWAKDMKHGKGVFRYAEGDAQAGAQGGEERYEGEFCDDEFHGRGRYIFATGDIYEGGYHSGQMHGRGCLKRAIGEYYNGEWSRGVRQGVGAAGYASGDSYEGEWAEDARHGRGACTQKDGCLDLIVSARGQSLGAGLRRTAAGKAPAWTRLLDGEPAAGGRLLEAKEAAALAAKLGFPAFSIPGRVAEVAAEATDATEVAAESGR